MLASKQNNQGFHALKRARERYGLQLTHKDLRNIVRKIQAGKSTCIQKRSLRETTHALSYQGTPIVVGYDKVRQTICTFLPYSVTGK